jgi:hypothetical protein
LAREEKQEAIEQGSEDCKKYDPRRSGRSEVEEKEKFQEEEQKDKNVEFWLVVAGRAEGRGLWSS